MPLGNVNYPCGRRASKQRAFVKFVCLATASTAAAISSNRQGLAESVTIFNRRFETPQYADGGYSALITPVQQGVHGWFFGDASGIYNPSALDFPSTSDNGTPSRRVDAADLAIRNAGFGRAEDEMPGSGDNNRNLRTEGEDFLYGQRQLGATPPTLAGGAVPEPRSIALLAIVVLPFMRDKRRRLASNVFLVSTCAVIACSQAMSAHVVQAQGNTYWIGATGDWLTPANWTNGVPNSDVAAYINNGGRAQIINQSATAGDLVLLAESAIDRGYLEVFGGDLQLSRVRGGQMIVGNRGVGDLIILNGGTASGRTASIGHYSGSVGTATVAGLSATWTNHEWLIVGNSGDGSLEILRSGVVNNTTSAGTLLPVTIGYQGTGVVTVDGQNSKFFNDNNLVIGDLGDGTLHIADGGMASALQSTLGMQSTGVGVAVIGGTGAHWTNSSDLVLGNAGEGSLAVTDGGLVTNFNGNLGVLSGAKGTAIVNGVSAWNNQSVLAVGIQGEGSLSISDRGSVSSNAGRIAREAGSTGVVVVDGHDSRWTNAGDLLIGNGGIGSLTIQNSGLVGNANGNIGVLPGSSGVVNVTGAGSLWSNGVIAVGIMGQGTLHIADGAIVTSTNGRIARDAGSTGVASVDGAGSKWTATGAMTIGMATGGPGSLSVTNGGEVQVIGGMTVGSQGVLSGDGLVFANVDSLGIVAPGVSPGALHIDGNYQQAQVGTLQIELGSPVDFDKLDVSGSLALSGVLEISLINDFVPFGSQSFDILDWGVGVSGTFTTIVLPTLNSTLTWDTSRLYDLGVLSVTGPAAPADFNSDGKVNDEDLDVFQAGFGLVGPATRLQGDADDDHDVDGNDFLFWQRELGGNAAWRPWTHAVPEQSGLLTSIIIMLAIASICRR